MQLPVVFAPGGGLSPLQPQVDLMGVRVPPLAHPVLETRHSTIGIGSGEAGGERADHNLCVRGDERGLRGNGAVIIFTGFP